MLEAHPLAPALRWALLPAPEQTQFLRACLLRGPAAERAWQAWRAGGADVQARLARRRGGARRLLPLLHRSVKRNGIALEPGILTYLRSATLYEGLRARTYRRLLRAVLAALAEVGAEALLLKGPALAATVYERWSLRHCHDIDLLAPEGGVGRVSEALAAAGFAPAGARGRSLRHPSGLPALIHTDLFQNPHYRLPAAWRHSQEITVGGVPARVLCPQDLLAHVCGHAAGSASRETLQWACDAWTLLDRTPALDWPALEARIAEAGLALPLAVMLDYLRNELDAPVPEGLVARLGAFPTVPPARDAALAGARAGTRGTLSQLLRHTPGLGRRGRLLWWSALPSAEYVRSANPALGRGQLLGYYFRRAWGFLARRLQAI
jgi:hypothetical protein